jgi:hypothetical protein
MELYYQGHVFGSFGGARIRVHLASLFFLLDSDSLLRPPSLACDLALTSLAKTSSPGSIDPSELRARLDHALAGRRA